MTLWLLVVLPVAAGASAALFPRAARMVAAVGLGSVAGLGAWAAAGEATSVVAWGAGLELSLGAVGFARVMVVLVPVVALPIVLYAAATETVGRTKLIALLTAFVGAMQLLVLAGDLLTLLIGWELVGALSWILIAHQTAERSSAQRASHAFVTTRFGDLGLYLAAGITFASTGSFDFTAIGQIGSAQLQFVAGGILLAAAAKSAQPPFSPWLFSAMAGPTPVSALLHSSTMVAAGAYLLVRLAPALGSVPWFSPAVVSVGMTGALAGGMVAAVHRHPKRLLAGSTTAQYGLMFVAIGAGSVFAAAAQMVTHAAFKALLFLTAGTAMHASHSEDIARMGLGRRLPAVGAFAAAGALALAAVPPMGGAWSKEQITAAAFETSALLGAAVVLAALLSAFYALRYWVLAYGPGSRPSGEARLPAAGGASVGFLALLSVAMSALWLPQVGRAAERLVPGEVVEIALPELVVSLAAIAAGALLVNVLRRRSLLASSGLRPWLASTAAGWFGLPALSRRLIVDPVLSTSRGLAAFDDRVIDAGVRASIRVATGLSRLMQRRWEVSIDSAVNGVAGATMLAARGSRIADERAVDRTAEGIARAVGRGGGLTRKLQTGLSHHYYVVVVAGVGLLAFVLMNGRS